MSTVPSSRDPVLGALVMQSRPIRFGLPHSPPGQSAIDGNTLEGSGARQRWCTDDLCRPKYREQRRVSDIGDHRIAE